MKNRLIWFWREFLFLEWTVSVEPVSNNSHWCSSKLPCHELTEEDCFPDWCLKTPPHPPFLWFSKTNFFRNSQNSAEYQCYSIGEENLAINTSIKSRGTVYLAEGLCKAFLAETPGNITGALHFQGSYFKLFWKKRVWFRTSFPILHDFL